MKISSQNGREDGRRNQKLGLSVQSADWRSRRLLLPVIAILALAVGSVNGQSFLYAPNASSGNISAYTLDSATGALIPVPGAPFSTPGSPRHAAVSPNGRFIYVNKPDLGRISIYSINPTSGALSDSPGSPFPHQGVGLATEPTGRFLYVERPELDTVSGFMLDLLTGAPGSPVPGSPFATGPFPYDTMAVHPSGRFLYQTNAALYGGQSSVFGFSINLQTGALTPVPGSPIPVVGPANNISIDSTGRFAYAAVGGMIYGFNIDAATGSLSWIPGSPFLAGTSNAGIATDRLGRFVFLAGGQDSTLSVFQIDQTTGALSVAPGSPYAFGYPSGMAVDPTNSFLYVALNASIAALRIDQNSGTLSPVPGSPFPAGSGTGYLMVATPTTLYNVCSLYDPTRAVRSGATLAIKLLLCDGAGTMRLHLQLLCTPPASFGPRLLFPKRFKLPGMQTPTMTSSSTPHWAAPEDTAST